MHPQAETRSVWPFFGLAYALSWLAWAPWLVAPESGWAAASKIAGGFGPWAAALVLLALRRERLLDWLVGLFRWRVAARFYAFALLFPPALALLMAGLFALAGGTLYLALIPAGLASYPGVFLAVALIGGGNEEPGWRGYALAPVQARFGPLAGSFVLGIVWALWHLPLLAANPDLLALPAGPLLLVVGGTLLSITLHAFWYTWLMNRTGSVLLCILLHAGYNAANGVLLPIPPEALEGTSYLLPQFLMIAVLGASVLALVLATGGRLGRAGAA